MKEMNTEILGSVLQIVALVVLSYPLGRYIAKVYKGERTWLDFMAPVEKWMYKISFCSSDRECILVFLGYGVVGMPGLVAVES